jgi:hypothetical protein
MRHILDHRQNQRAGASSAASSAATKRRSLLLRLTTGAAFAAVLAGCTPGTTVSPAPPTETQATETQATETHASETQAATRDSSARSGEGLADTAATPSGNPDAAATETVKQTVTNALTQLAAAAPKPATEQVTDALTGAGIAPGVLQVSQSRTPTGLEADAIEAAVRQGNDCIIGQVREGAVAVTVLPVLASGKCFVGS